MFASLMLGAPNWLVAAGVVMGVATALVVWSYWRNAMKLPPRLLAATLKIAAIAALAFCLLEPLFSGVRPRPGANLFVLMADNSRSLRVRDADQGKTRGELLQAKLDPATEWQTRLSQDFDVRRYTFDRHLHPVQGFAGLPFDGSASSMFAALSDLTGRFHGRPNAGALLFSDGHSTDQWEQIGDWDALPPVYPVVLGGNTKLRDLRINRVTVSQTNFEAAPVTIAAEVVTENFAGDAVIMQLLDETGTEIQRVTRRGPDAQPLAHRFEFRPDKPGVSFYRVRAFAEVDEAHLDEPDKTSEATLENNARWVVVDRGGGPYRVLYVTGRPNWEFKFLHRALQEDEEVDLVGLIRIAKKEPKFTFRSRNDESSNSLFRGFGNQEDEETEQYDQPVLLRIGTEDSEELRDGFPQASEELFRYHAVVLDDVEAAYFTQDQMSLIQEFVSQRGGGFLMLGGRESFAGGKYARTPIGELLPVYADVPASEPADQYSLALTREGWLQPWVRIRSTQQAEEKRFNEMPAFRTVNRVRSIKPGASVLSRVRGSDDKEYPALVVQRFGKGRTAATLVGDLWRWNLRRTNSEESDLERSWRQTIRWLVADVPGRVEVEVRRRHDDPTSPVELLVRVRDEKFRPLDNATVVVNVKTPDGSEVSLPAESSDDTAGAYTAVFASRTPGPYHAEVAVTADDGSEIGTRQTGWAAEPTIEEFEVLTPDRPLLEQIAAKTGGEVIELDQLQDFVSSLPNRKIPVTEPWIYPLWHQWSVFALAIGCLIGEWGLRRWNGLP